MKILINKFNRAYIEEINTTFDLDLPLTKKSYITIYDHFMDYPINERLDMLIDAFPNNPLILIHSRKDAEDNYQQSMFPKDWKRVPRLLNAKRDVIWYVNPHDYIRVAPNQTTKGYQSDGACRVIHSILLNIKYPISVMDFNLMQWFESKGHSHIQAKAQVEKYTQLYFTKKLFVARINIIYSGLDIPHLDLIRETVYKFEDLDLFKMKLLYVLYFKASPSLDMIKEYRGTPTPNTFEKTETQHNPRESAEIFVKACKKFVGLNIDIDDIYTAYEEVAMDENFIQQYMDEEE